jgi:hypothetical protein
VRLAELPCGENVSFLDTAFFQQPGGTQPSPKEVREKDIEVNGIRARTSRPPPIPYWDQGLVVKYGSEITIAEG